jgi:hypothetical protein
MAAVDAGHGAGFGAGYGAGFGDGARFGAGFGDGDYVVLLLEKPIEILSFDDKCFDTYISIQRANQKEE